MIIKYPEYLTEENVVIDFKNHTITAKEGGYVDKDGMSYQALYSYLKEVWKTTDAIKYELPIMALDKLTFLSKGLWKFKGKHLLTEGTIYNNFSEITELEKLKREQFEYEFRMELRRKKLKKIDEYKY